MGYGRLRVLARAMACVRLCTPSLPHRLYLHHLAIGGGRLAQPPLQNVQACQQAKAYLGCK